MSFSSSESGLARASSRWLILVLCTALLGSGAARSQPPLTAAERNVFQAERLLREARRSRDAGDLPRSAQALTAITRLTFPNDPEALELLAGAHAGLAEVRLLQGRLDEAAQVAQQGLRRATRPSRPTFFRAELFRLLGDVAARKGDSRAAERHRRDAEAVRRSLR